MSKWSGSPSIHHVGSLKSPPQYTRSKFDQNGSAVPFHTSSTPFSKQKTMSNQSLTDPDEIFAKHSVHEVKSILHKLRTDVDAKQEELRLMVGERYRDLLEASTSIISMSQSSKRVVNAVTRMKRIVTEDLRAQNLSNGANKRGEQDDAQLKVYQCLAAHLKFLVDAPEHLWRFLERKQCLHAAWLFMLARVVYRSLTSEDLEEGQNWARQGIVVKEQFPLVQKQWESLSQFRTQISHKATLFLREPDLRPQDLCASMLTLHLLDSLPLSDALDVFLKQRYRSLQILYQSIKESWEKNTDSSSRHIERPTMKSVWDILRSVLASIITTVGNSREVFGKRPDGPPSMISQVLLFTQTDSAQPTATLPSELCLSSHGLISSLPNCSHFLALPMDIWSYRPFFDLDSQSSKIKQDALNSKLRAWFTKATEHLHESSGSWLYRLETIKNVWELRSHAMDWLSVSSALLEVEDKEALCLLVDDVCRTRVQDIWAMTLQKISFSFRETLQSTVSAIIQEKEDAHFDLFPVEYSLSAPPVPSVTQASLNVPIAQSSFRRFKHDIQQRIDGITPLIGKIMSDAESAALRLHNDLQHVFESDRRSLEESYSSDAEKAASDFLDAVQNFFDVDDHDPGHSIKRLLFLSRLTQKLSLSPLIGYLRCPTAFSQSYRALALQIYDLCTDKYSSMVALSARDRFLGNFVSKVQVGHHDLSYPSSPSPGMMDSLLALVEATEVFVQSKDDTKRSTIVAIILSRYVNAVVEALAESPNRAGLQLVWDLRFLQSLCDDWDEALTKPTALISQGIEQAFQSLSQEEQSTCLNLEKSVQEDVLQSIRRARLLLSPLIAPSDRLSSTKSPKLPTSDINRHKPSGIQVGGERELQPVMNLVKPSARFGLLWVASAAVQ